MKLHKSKTIKGMMGQARRSVDAIDARVPYHLAGPLPLGPYTVMRGRSVFSISTNTAGQKTVLLVGPHTLNNATSAFNAATTPLIAINGVGTDVPGAALGEQHHGDGLALTYASTTYSNNTASAGLHACTVVITCTTNALKSSGQVYMGSLNQRVARTRFATWNACGDSLIARREMVPFSATHVMRQGLAISCYPVDTIDWAAQRPLITNSSTLADNVTMDSLSQLAFVFMDTDTDAVEYTITVYTEWRMNFMDAALASTATSKVPGSLPNWNKIGAAAQASSGFLRPATPGVTPVGIA